MIIIYHNKYLTQHFTTFFVLCNKKTYNLLCLVYSISANLKPYTKQEIVCHAYSTTETILFASFFGSFGIIFRRHHCQPWKTSSC